MHNRKPYKLPAIRECTDIKLGGTTIKIIPLDCVEDNKYLIPRDWIDPTTPSPKKYDGNKAVWIKNS